jgi:hypothetical protein
MKILSEEEVSNRITEIENLHDIWQYQINGYCVWQILRFRISTDMSQMPFGTNSLTKSKLLRIFGLLSDTIKDLIGIIFSRRADLLALTCSSALAEEVNGRFKDVYFDDLLINYNSCFKIETINSKNFSNRRKLALVKVNITEAAFDLFTSILAKCLKGSTEINRISAILSDIIVNETHLEYYSQAVLSNIINSFIWKKHLYSLMLKKLKPKYILLIDTSRFEITAAAKELGIKVIEFQHGIFTKYHPDVLSSNAKPFKRNLIIKDKYFLYGDYWKQQLDLNEFYDNELRVIGNPRIDNYRALRSEYLKKFADDIFRIVLTTQNLDTEKLIKFMTGFLDLAEGRIKYLLYIKLHPSQEGSKVHFEDIFKNNKNVLVLLGNEEPNTFELIAMASCHVSIGSACHYDSIGLGVPTIVLPLAGHEIVLNLVKIGHASLAETPAELLNIILHKKFVPVTSEISESYFKAGALSNMKNELNHD